MSPIQQDIAPPALPSPAHVPSISANSTLPVHASYIIDHLKSEVKRFEDSYTREREARKEVQKKYFDLKDELLKLKTDHQIENIQNEKPSGLSGLAENPIVLKLVEHAGPALGALMMKLVDGGAMNTPQLTGGTGVQLDDNTAAQLQQINAWYSSLSNENQQSVFTILDAFAKIHTPEQLAQNLNRINNLLKNGTTATPHIFQNGTFN